MLEEIGFKYKVTKIRLRSEEGDFSKGEQFKPEFRRISPFSKIPVIIDHDNNKEGIFAIGDICTYPGKLKLILSGFHEGALAARGCFKLARPNEKYRFEYTTTSKSIQERLGIKRK